jgi:phage FluMu protein Com
MSELAKLHCEACSRFLAEYRPSPELELKIKCKYCKSVNVISGYSLTLEIDVSDKSTRTERRKRTSRIPSSEYG